MFYFVDVELGEYFYVSGSQSVWWRLRCGLDDRQIGVRFPAEARNFFKKKRLDLPSLLFGFCEAKRPSRKTGHIATRIAKVQNAWSYTSIALLFYGFLLIERGVNFALIQKKHNCRTGKTSEWGGFILCFLVM